MDTKNTITGRPSSLSGLKIPSSWITSVRYKNGYLAILSRRTFQGLSKRVRAARAWGPLSTPS
jgi:hypothetical protein